MTIPLFEKSPGAKLDFTLDVRKKINPAYVHKVTWTTSDPALVVGNGSNGMPAPSNTDTDITVWVDGGTPGTKPRVEALITTRDGRVHDAAFEVKITGAALAPRHPQPQLQGLGVVAAPMVAPWLAVGVGSAVVLAPTLYVAGVRGWRLVGASAIGAIGFAFLWWRFGAASSS